MCVCFCENGDSLCFLDGHSNKKKRKKEINDDKVIRIRDRINNARDNNQTTTKQTTTNNKQQAALTQGRRRQRRQRQGMRRMTRIIMIQQCRPSSSVILAQQLATISLLFLRLLLLLLVIIITLSPSGTIVQMAMGLCLDDASSSSSSRGSSNSRILPNNIAIHKVPLDHHNPKLPYCYAVTNPSDLLLRQDISSVSTTRTTKTTTTTPNFLATQVWPSARVAAHCLLEAATTVAAAATTTTVSTYENGMDGDDSEAKNSREIRSSPLKLSLSSLSSWTVCELGCGPGLPALTAASLGASQVYATDLDPLALQLVDEAAKEQGYKDCIQTSIYDLTTILTTMTKTTTMTRNDLILKDKGEEQQQQQNAQNTKGSSSHNNINNIDPPQADLYIMSDVFESSQVARGAAHVVHRLLVRQQQRGQQQKQQSHVWVFCQTDRSQRDIFWKRCVNFKIIQTCLGHCTTTIIITRTTTTTRILEEMVSFPHRPRYYRRRHLDYGFVALTKRLWNMDDE